MTQHQLPLNGQRVLVWFGEETEPRIAQYVSNQWLVEGCLSSPGVARSWQELPKLETATS